MDRLGRSRPGSDVRGRPVSCKVQSGMAKHHRANLDRAGTRIVLGSRVRICVSARLYKAHPEFRRSFRKVAGRIKTVVGWDGTGGAWIDLGRSGVLTVEPQLLKVVGWTKVRPVSR